jgi:hypothetical protein
MEDVPFGKMAMGWVGGQNVAVVDLDSETAAAVLSRLQQDGEEDAADGKVALPPGLKIAACQKLPDRMLDAQRERDSDRGSFGDRGGYGRSSGGGDRGGRSMGSRSTPAPGRAWQRGGEGGGGGGERSAGSAFGSAAPGIRGRGERSGTERVVFRTGGRGR